MDTVAEFVCTICGARKSRFTRWFLLTENPRLDRLQVLDWNGAKARRPEMFSVCGSTHVGELVAHWMATGSLSYPFACGPSSRRGRGRESAGHAPGPEPRLVVPGHVIGELVVHRESLDRVLRENPYALSSVLDALLQALDGPQPPRLPPPVEEEALEEERRVA